VQYFRSELEKRQIKSAFQHYVSSKVVDEIMHDVSKLRLGGEKRDLTVLFSDIRGFTSMSEQMAPEDLVRLLNSYLTRMTENVFQNDGLLDKYIGDAIMAIYGAPIYRADHAVLACRTALEMMTALFEMQAEWRRHGSPVLDIGIGINSGPMIVGNMGSQARFDYTVIGDAVNLGSRIESMNKDYGTHILLSEYTYQYVRDAFRNLREVHVANIRGRGARVRLYELIPDGVYPNLDWLDEFARGYTLYHSERRKEALPIFQALSENVHDPVSQYYLRREQHPLRRSED
jgi:adenylate cyclase